MRIIIVIATVVCLAAFSMVKANSLVNGGFETWEPIGGEVTDQIGDWNTDLGEIVGPVQGMAPFEGQAMLHFVAAGRFGPSTLVSSQIIQLIDITPISSQVAAGNVLVTGSYWVNRVTGDADTDTQFDLKITAHNGIPASFPDERLLDIGAADAVVQSDSDPLTWEGISVSLLLPPSTAYVAFWMSATENVYNDSQSAEFDGHYADDASLVITVIPEPATLALLTLGGLLMLRQKRMA